MDNQHLLLKNANLRPYHTFTSLSTDANLNDLGKWQLVAETALGRKSTATRTLQDWFVLVRDKPINLEVARPRESEMNLLGHFKAFQSANAQGEAEEEE